MARNDSRVFEQDGEEDCEVGVLEDIHEEERRIGVHRAEEEVLSAGEDDEHEGDQNDRHVPCSRETTVGSDEKQRLPVIEEKRKAPPVVPLVVYQQMKSAVLLAVVERLSERAVE